MVAVAVMDCPTEAEAATLTLNVTLPVPFVITAAEPRNVWPSPFPDPSHEEFEKKSSMNVALAVLLSVP